MDVRDEIIKYLKRFDFDIRKIHDARFMDQKCTPDVVCFIAECVKEKDTAETLNLDLTTSNQSNKPFTVKDIWKSSYFIESTQAMFGKPSPKEDTAKSEYDKFIQQPLRMLSYAKILDFERGGGAKSVSR